jgi:hypothetical protein
VARREGSITTVLSACGTQHRSAHHAILPGLRESLDSMVHGLGCAEVSEHSGERLAAWHATANEQMTSNSGDQRWK